MFSKRIARAACFMLAVTAVVLVIVSPGTAARHAAKATTLTIWTDQDRQAAVQKVGNAWGAARGVTINVVVKNFGDIRDQLNPVDAATAPDIVVAAHDWTGQLAANGLIEPLYPSKAV